MERIKSEIDKNLDSCVFSDKIKEEMKSLYNGKLNGICIRLEIKDNKFIFEYGKDRQIHIKERRERIIELLKKIEREIGRRKIKIENCLIYLLMMDNYYYQDDRIPFFTFAKPKNRGGILYPDDDIINFLEKKKEVKIYEIEENRIYFRGRDTDKLKYDLRRKLSKEESEILKIEISEDYIDISEFSRYKYLLNLGGNQPWSYRFRYLFLLERLVINISVHQVYDDDKNLDWKTFFDILFIENKDYINIKYTWKEGDKKINELNYKKLVSNINFVYKKLEENENIYNKIRENGIKKINLINEELLYDSYIYLIKEYSKRYNKKIDIKVN